jgi:acetyltransferase-like isoleucine patch superfamily enzyme
MSWVHELRRRRSMLTANVLQRAWQRMQQAGVVTAESHIGRQFAAFGPRSMLAFPVGSVYGERWIEIGDETMIADHVTICAGMAPGHDLGPEPVLHIGDRCVIGRGSHIVAHYSIDIGSDVFTGPYVYITDQNHQYEDPDVPIGRQWPVNSAVSIGVGCWLGTGTVILPGSRIGRNVVVAAGSVVRGEVPDHCVVAGVPAKVVRSYLPGDGWSPARPGQASGPATRTGSLAAGESPAGAVDPMADDPEQQYQAQIPG